MPVASHKIKKDFHKIKKDFAEEKAITFRDN
jgi:hypothetical protein